MILLRCKLQVDEARQGQTLSEKRNPDGVAGVLGHLIVEDEAWGNFIVLQRAWSLYQEAQVFNDNLATCAPYADYATE